MVYDFSAALQAYIFVKILSKLLQEQPQTKVRDYYSPEDDVMKLLSKSPAKSRSK